MEGYYSTGQSPERGVTPMEEEEEKKKEEEEEEEEEGLMTLYRSTIRF